MSSLLIEKKLFNKNFFYLILLFSYLFIFLISFLISFYEYPKFGDKGVSILFSNIYLMAMPPISSAVLSYLLILFILNWSNSYINKKFIVTIKDTLAHISVFLMIIINGVSYINKEIGLDISLLITEKQSKFNLIELIVTAFQPVNIVYSTPLLLSIPTLIFLALEHCSIATQDHKWIKIRNKPNSAPPKSEKVMEAENIIFQTKIIIAESKLLLKR